MKDFTVNPGLFRIASRKRLRQCSLLEVWASGIVIEENREKPPHLTELGVLSRA